MPEEMNTTVDISRHAQTSENVRAQFYMARGTNRYPDVLDRVRELVTAKYHEKKSNQGDNKEEKNITKLSEENLKRMIESVITDNNITCELSDDVTVLSNHIYHDMAGYSFISREKIFENTSFEEMNIDGWNRIWVQHAGERTQKTEYSFLSPEHANTILLRMFSQTNTPFDKGMPYATADIGDNVRISAYREPVVSEEVGAVASIRKVSGSTITREKLTELTLTEEMLVFLELTASHGVSQCYAGETSSGKTTTTGYILKEISKKLRMFTIEESAREWDFRIFDEDGNVINSIVHTRTRPSDDPARNIDQSKLLQGALRFDPDLIGVGEMRSDEAFAAIEASNTGHAVVTTTHSSSATDSPYRLMTLAKKAFEFADHTLMRMIVDAFPIQVFQRRLADGARIVSEIVEILAYKNGELEYKTLYDYHVTDNIRDEESGRVIEVVGKFRHLNAISEKLQQKMLMKGATRKELAPYVNIPTEHEVA